MYLALGLGPWAITGCAYVALARIAYDRPPHFALLAAMEIAQHATLLFGPRLAFARAQRAAEGRAREGKAWLLSAPRRGASIAVTSAVVAAIGLGVGMNVPFVGGIIFLGACFLRVVLNVAFFVGIASEASNVGWLVARGAGYRGGVDGQTRRFVTLDAAEEARVLQRRGAEIDLALHALDDQGEPRVVTCVLRSEAAAP
jgi:hypothetical protein